MVLTDLRRATQYEVQVRARTQAGYGSFSPAAIFRTLPDGEKKSSAEDCLKDYSDLNGSLNPYLHNRLLNRFSNIYLFSSVSLWLTSLLVWKDCWLSFCLLSYSSITPNTALLTNYSNFLALCFFSPFLVSFVCLVCQDTTLPHSSWCLASLSLSGCCCSSLSSLWPSTAYGENVGKGKEGEEKTDLQAK